MKLRMHLSAIPALLALLLFCGVPVPLATEKTVPDPLNARPGNEEDELFMLAEEELGASDLGVLVAAPRASINRRVAGVLLVERPGRTLNVVQGERVRFVSGIREAVWYEGRGRVESALALFELDPAGTATLIGRDGIALRGAAPRIAHGRVHVDATFDQVGTFTVEARIRTVATPYLGGRAARGRRAIYEIRVWSAGELGVLSGFVGGEADGLPLVGMPVVALDLATRQPVGGARTGCDGMYAIRRLPPGDYLVAVPGRPGFAGEFYDDAPDAASATPITIAPGGALSGIDFLLARD